MKQSLRLGTLAGIPVGLHWGLLVIAVFYLANLATGFFPAAAPGASDLAYWLAATAGVVLFFASILAHEVGHSLVAQREGIRVRAITLWLLGGVAEIEDEPTTPGAEFRIAAAGPAVSIALAVAFVGLGFAFSAVFGGGLTATTLVWLGLINGILAAFNLVPAAPLDGGRILAAALWWRSGNATSARLSAARAGQVFGLVLSGLGGLVLFNGGGIFVLIVAWFIHAGASAERRRVQIMAAVDHAFVREVMAPLAPPTDGAVTLAGLEAMAAPGSTAFPIRGSRGTVVGVVPPSAVAGTQPKQRHQTTAGDIVVRWDSFVSARSDEPLNVLIDRFKTHDVVDAIVYDVAGRQVGYVGLSELSHVDELHPA